MFLIPAGPPAVRPDPIHRPGAHTRSGNGMGRTRLGLLAGAARAFAEHGVRRSTMQSIATAAGVAKATLYNHFRTKDDVLTALVRTELDRLTGIAAALPVQQALATLSDELGAHPVLRRLADIEPDALSALLSGAPDTWAHLTARLAQALRVDADSAELAAQWLLGVILQPGRSTARHRHAALLAGVLTAAAPVGPAGALSSAEQRG